MKQTLLEIKRSLFIISLISLTHCGGGTAGTSSTDGFVPKSSKIVSGVLTNENNVGIGNASVSVGETGDSTTTDESGRFILTTETDENSEHFTLNINSSGNSTSVNVTNLINENSALDLSVQTNNFNDSANLDGAEFTVLSVSGSGCENKFSDIETFKFTGSSDPLLVVNQIAEIAHGKLCTLQVEVSPKGNSNQDLALELYSSQLRSSRDVANNELQMQKLISTTPVGGAGVWEVPFIYKKELNTGYYDLEINSGLPRTQRVAIIINLLK